MTYFLPINSKSLAHYFVCACIKPARYYENKPQDLQDGFRNAILLSTELGTNDTDCCIELVLTKDEENRLIPCGKDFYLLPVPLPISRVKTVYFRDQRQLDLTVTNINMSTAFIPRSLAKVASFSNVEIDSACEENKLSEIDFAQSLELYDRILGALALMKTAKEPYMNYSENYASTLSFFNLMIKNDLDRQGRKINDKFFGLFSRTGTFVKYIPYLEKKISKEDLDQIAAENNQKIERSYTKTIKYDSLSGITYAIAILQSYGVGNEAATKKIDALITTNFENLKEGTAEGIALYYGYNRGYSAFSNCYGTEETGRQNVKYLLDSQLDYYTIESIYQFAFNSNNASSQFPYIDEWCPRKKESPKRRNDYMVLDTKFIGKKKPSVFSKEYLADFLAEIKKFDFLNLPLSSLVEQVRNKVAGDAKEEIEETSDAKIAEVEAKWASKYTEAQASIESLKGEVASQDGIISDLQKRNADLLKEIEMLKTNSIQPAQNGISVAGVLNEPESNYGTESENGEQNGSPSGPQPINSTSNTVDGYASGKKSKKSTQRKSGSGNKKTSANTPKRTTKKELQESADIANPEPDAPKKVAPTLFDQNE